ncbi:hypothetical protein [Rhizobium indicum]|uniref:Uncharacterized protein n=1 Tax=Rhizobium indicum TaxID=2583231 RepID=A0ABX6PNW3_9HYPH|nr:hypothetical protein [Rhizobium indicum]QKK20377.1 hypothetical protein FFM53_028625 [Rhizobium indicum]QKK33195.1 hypothetical protein FE844_026785 [Rhizobium indicum]
MKSPWKFLAQLTSRRRPVEARESGVGADTEASESGAGQTSALSSDSTEASGRRDHDENATVDLVARTTSNEADGDPGVARAVSPPVDVEEVQTPADHAVSRSGTDAHRFAPEGKTSKMSPRTPPSGRQGRAKKTRTDRGSESTDVANSDQGAQSSSSRESFFDEVASVDEEIRQLRGQLAQKLHLQNVQLEKMLERFDRS